MIIEQKPLFKRTYKKLYKNQLLEINAAIRTIMTDPVIGEEKKGDLAGVRVYKFDVQNQLYLLAYTVDETTITLLALGVHENFYRNLKK
jgi:mRNA interferase RelE/StbE